MSLSGEQQRAADEIGHCYQELGPSNVVNELMSDEGCFQWQHYPCGDVKDFQHHSQYFYHSHPVKDEDAVFQHGHFHVFIRQGALPKDAAPVVASKAFHESRGEKDNLAHLLGIAMNEYGRPKALFTVNHWVVLGAWYEASTLIALLDNFKVDIDNSPYAQSNRWLTNMISLFKPFIADLLIKRDEVILACQKDQPGEAIFYDKQLEITSVMPLV